MGAHFRFVHCADLHLGSRFKGVSTRWLHLYFGWYKWLRAFCRSPDTAIKQIVRGDYENTWRSIRDLGSPFRDNLMNPLKC